MIWEHIAEELVPLVLAGVFAGTGDMLLWVLTAGRRTTGRGSSATSRATLSSRTSRPTSVPRSGLPSSGGHCYGPSNLRRPPNTPIQWIAFGDRRSPTPFGDRSTLRMRSQHDDH